MEDINYNEARTTSFVLTFESFFFLNLNAMNVEFSWTIAMKTSSFKRKFLLNSNNKMFVLYRLYEASRNVVKRLQATKSSRFFIVISFKIKYLVHSFSKLKKKNFGGKQSVKPLQFFYL